MACNKCYECGCNDGKDYCQDCFPDEGTWIITKAEKPDPFYADKNHAYLDPQNNLWILNHDRTEMIRINGSGGGGTTYKAGQGITIANGTISVNNTPTVNSGANILVSKSDNDYTLSLNPTVANNASTALSKANTLEGKVTALENRPQGKPLSQGEGIYVKDNGNYDTVSVDFNKVPSMTRFTNLEKTVGELKAPSGTVRTKVLGKNGIKATETPAKDFEVELEPATKTLIDSVPDLRTRIQTLEGKPTTDTNTRVLFAKKELPKSNTTIGLNATDLMDSNAVSLNDIVFSSTEGEVIIHKVTSMASGTLSLTYLGSYTKPSNTESNFNFINAYEGNGILGRYIENDANQRYISLPYYFFQYNNLNECGIATGTTMYLHISYTMVKGNPPSGSLIKAELYNTRVTPRYIRQITTQNLKQKDSFTVPLQLGAGDIVADAVALRIDKANSRDNVLRIDKISLTRKRPVGIESVPPPSGQVAVGGDNLLKGTKDLSGNTYGSFNTSDSYLSYKVAKGTRGNGIVDFANFNVTAPLRNGWYTLGFYAKASTSGAKLVTHLFSPSVVISANSSTATVPGTGGDGYVEHLLTSEWDWYWVNYNVANSTSAPRALFRIQPSLAPAGTTIEICAPVFYRGTGGRSWGPSSEDVPVIDNSAITNKLTQVENDVTALKAKPDNDTKYYAGTGLSLSGTTFNVNTSQLATATQLNAKADSTTVTQLRTDLNNLKAEYERTVAALHKIVANLQGTGAWTGGITGQFVSGRNIATGNINIFGGGTDGGSFIRTSSGNNENDLAGGV